MGKQLIACNIHLDSNYQKRRKQLEELRADVTHINFVVNEVNMIVMGDFNCSRSKVCLENPLYISDDQNT